LIVIKREIRKYAKKKRAKSNAWFFKTSKGEYGEGDKFLGLTMGEQRLVARKYGDLSLARVRKLLERGYHEERMIGLLILVHKYKFAKNSENNTGKKKIFNFYIRNRKAINNWDLVDVTTPNIIGDFLLGGADRKILYRFAKSKNIWERRMAVLATFKFIKQGDFKDALAISKILLSDRHDLIHKAVGWMLREVGKKDKKTLIKFLGKYSTVMPRTALRYSLEKFSKKERKKYMTPTP